MPFPHGVPSLSTMSRVLAAVDEELVSLALMNWVGEISNTRGIHIAIDGKGLRAAAHKVRDEKTPYILNAIDAATKLVIGQLVIREKTNEAATIPSLIEMLEVEGSTVTIDAIGATENIMNAIHDKGGEFVLQVKKNCPALYDELMALFQGLSEEQESNREEFREQYRNHYSETETLEKNRERYEYRKCQSYHEPEGMKGLQEERPYVASVGRIQQVRILQVQDKCGKDVTPGLTEFLEKGSRRQPKSTTSGSPGDRPEWAGIVSSRVMNAKEILDYKRQHWSVENQLHYVLDETFGEDKSTVRQGKNTMSILRKCAYNIVRLLQMENPKGREYVPDVIDDISDELEIGLKMIFSPIPSHY